MRQILLGTDEAGYGPNLGPLVVAITAWESDSENLSFLLEPLKNEGIVIGDSKKLYHGGSLGKLEIGVRVPLRTLDKDVVPTETDEEKMIRLSTKFETILQQHHVRLLDMKYRVVEPKEFNQLLDRFGTKGTVLSYITLRLISDQLAQLASAENSLPVLVLCDKHGGRNYYLEILTEFFPGAFIQPLRQSRVSSEYRLISTKKEPEAQCNAVPDQAIEFRFLAKGESHVPIAIASMLAKYRRELAMIQFNAFWRAYVPDLQPTAGYPEDAKRFRRQVADVQKALGITDEVFWRKR